MHALLISSSPHKEESKTFLLAQQAVRGLSDAGITTETVHLSRHHINFCQHCEACHKKILNCFLKDDARLIIEKMLEADGIIFASPNYINQITASLKALFERASHFIHCKRLLDKYVIGVVSSGSGEDKEVLDYIEYYAHTCGAQYAGGISACAYAINEKAEEAYQLGKKFAYAIKEKKVYPKQMKIIESGRGHFRRVIELRKDDWQGEYAYWQSKGWL